MSSVKRATICAFCIALCCVLPLAFHALGLGSAFSPMHIPALLCGLLCGWPYGCLCGIAGPVLSCLISGMPAPLQLVYFIPELAVYGLVSGLLYARIRTGNRAADLYLALVPAMLAGRIAGGAAQAVLFTATARAWSVGLWAAAYFAGTLPGTAAQLVLIPALVTALERARLIPARYPMKGEKTDA